MRAMTGHAVFLEQRLMKAGLESLVSNAGTECGAHADIGQRMTGDAALWTRAAQRRMAGKTIGFEMGLAAKQRSGRDHELRIDKNQRHQYQEIGRELGEQPVPLHFQPQNKKTARI